MSNRYVYRNESHSVSANQLFRINEDKTLALNLNYLYDKENRDANEMTEYLTDSVSRYVINESNSAWIRQHFIGANAVYKLNGRKTYLKNKISANVTFPKGEGLIDNLILQRLSGHSININNVLDVKYIKPGGEVADATVRVSYTDKDGLLKLPVSCSAQKIGQRIFKSDGAASLVALAVPHFMFNLNCGFEAEWQQAKTALRQTELDESGNQDTWNVGAHVTPKFLWHYGRKFQWLVYVPVGFIYYSADNCSWSYDKTFLSVRPYSNIAYKPTERLSFDLTTICEEAMHAALSLMVQKYYTNYRTATSNPAFVENKLNRTLKVALNAGYSNVLEMLFGNVTLSYAQSRYGISSGYDIADGIINYIKLPYSSHNRTWQANQTFSKGFFRWNSRIRESFSIGTSESEYFVSDVLHNGRINYMKANLSLNAAFADWVTFDTSNDFELSESCTDSETNGKKWHTFTNSTSLALWVCKRLCLMPSVMFHHNNYYSAYRNNVFLNCNVEYTLGKTMFFMQCDNLLDNNIFRRYSDNGVISYSCEYRLRGRTVMFGARIRIT